MIDNYPLIDNVHVATIDDVTADVARAMYGDCSLCKGVHVDKIAADVCGWATIAAVVAVVEGMKLFLAQRMNK